MPSDTAAQTTVIRHTDALHADAESLFGSEVASAWEAARAADAAKRHDDAHGPIAPLPIIIAAPAGDGRLAAGIFLLIEHDDSPDAEHDGMGGAGRATGEPPALGAPSTNAHGASRPSAPTSAARWPGVASIRQLVVRPEHRGRGLAGSLLRRAMSVARDAGCTRIRSTAGWGCPDHLMMYDRLRFTRASTSDRPYLVTRKLDAAS